MEKMREPAMAKRILSLMEAVWDPTLLNADVFTLCWKGIKQSVDPTVLEAYCFFAISTLEVESPENVFKNLVHIIKLFGQFYSFAAPDAILRVTSYLSKCIARQEALFSPYAPFDVTQYSRYARNEGDDSLSNWTRDLGSPQWVAFSSNILWLIWFVHMKGILNMYNTVPLNQD